MKAKKIKKVKNLFITLVILNFFNTPAHAYLDPATGSIILQAIIVFFATIFTYIVFFYKKILIILKKIINYLKKKID